MGGFTPAFLSDADSFERIWEPRIIPRLFSSWASDFRLAWFAGVARFIGEVGEPDIAIEDPINIRQVRTEALEESLRPETIDADWIIQAVPKRQLRCDKNHVSRPGNPHEGTIRPPSAGLRGFEDQGIWLNLQSNVHGLLDALKVGGVCEGWRRLWLW